MDFVSWKTFSVSVTCLKVIKNRVNYIVSPCGLHKVTYLGTNSLESHSRVLTFHFVTFEGIKDIFRLKITLY
ncbi:hypothetical protein Hanom_Chr01g00056651 [Helianthus anomalus]